MRNSSKHAQTPTKNKICRHLPQVLRNHPKTSATVQIQTKPGQQHSYQKQQRERQQQHVLTLCPAILKVLARRFRFLSCLSPPPLSLGPRVSLTRPPSPRSSTTPRADTYLFRRSRIPRTPSPAGEKEGRQKDRQTDRRSGEGIGIGNHRYTVGGTTKPRERMHTSLRRRNQRERPPDVTASARYLFDCSFSRKKKHKIVRRCTPTLSRQTAKGTRASREPGDAAREWGVPWLQGWETLTSDLPSVYLACTSAATHVTDSRKTTVMLDRRASPFTRQMKYDALFTSRVKAVVSVLKIIQETCCVPRNLWCTLCILRCPGTQYPAPRRCLPPLPAAGSPGEQGV